MISVWQNLLGTALTGFVGDHRALPVSEREVPGRLAVAPVPGEPRFTREEVVLALGRHVYLYFLDVPAAAWRHPVVSDLQCQRYSLQRSLCDARARTFYKL